MDNRYSARSLSLRLGNRQIIHDVSSSSAAVE